MSKKLVSELRELIYEKQWGHYKFVFDEFEVIERIFRPSKKVHIRRYYFTLTLDACEIEGIINISRIPKHFVNTPKYNILT